MRYFYMIFCAFVLVGAVLGSAAAVTIVVDPSGSGDATAIQEGLDLADFGWTVQVAPGLYLENLQMPSGVTLVSAAGSELTVIDAQGGIGIECIASAPGTRIEGFTLTGGGGYVAGGIRIYDHAHVEVSGCILRDNETTHDAAGIIVQRYSYADIHDNEFRDNRTLNSAAIAIIVDSAADITNNLFRGNVSTQLSGAIGINDAQATILGNVFMENVSVWGATVHVVHSTTQAFVAHNTFLANSSASGASGVYAYSDGSLTVANNIFAGNTGAAAVRSDGGYLAISCNDFWANEVDAVGIPNPIGDDGNMEADPLLCDDNDESAAVAYDSPCLNGPCGVIGANPIPACSGPVALEHLAWSEVKRLYR